MSSEVPTTLHASGLSPSQIEQMTQAATSAAANAYAPYSHFYVGAAILLESGAILSGCNVENASYRLTTCAEQTAIATAVAQHGPDIRIRAVVVVNRNGGVPCMPCGACRQTILEFASSECWVFYPGENGVTTNASFASLLPSAFHLAR